MAKPILYAEGLSVEADLTPRWWGTFGPSISAVSGAVSRAFTESLEDMGEVVSFTIGVNGIKARIFWPSATTQDDLVAWRKRMLDRFDAQPETREIQERWAVIEAERAAERASHRRMKASINGGVQVRITSQATTGEWVPPCGVTPAAT
jgi:hypothetical protein